MSHHQSRGDRSDSQQRRNSRPGGGSHQRGSTAKGSGAGGQGPSASAAPLLSPALQPAPVPSSKRSGGVNGQQRGHGTASFETSENQRTQQNTVAQHQQAHHAGIPHSGVRPSNLPSNGNVSRSSRPGTPSSSSSIEVAPIIPNTESSWNSGQPQLSFQFGSIGASSYVQIPARTNSAPPNLDEQKQDLLRYEAANVQASKVPIVSGGLPQGPRPQLQQSGGQQQGFRPQSQQSASGIASGIPPSPYQQAQQHPIPVQATQPNAHLQALPVATSQAHLQMQAYLVAPQPQQQGLVQLSYQQHTLQPQMQHNGGQVLKYAQSIPLAPLPGAMPTSQIPQISNHLPGGLTSGLPPGMPGTHGVGLVPSPIISHRASSAVKIVDPATNKEVKFDRKSSKSEAYSDSGVTVSAAPSQDRHVGNGPYARGAIGYVPGSHHQKYPGFYAPQQNGPYASAAQHYYQPPQTSSIPTAVSSGSASKHSVNEASQGTLEVPTPSTIASGPAAITVVRKEVNEGVNITVSPSVSGASISVPQSPDMEKQPISEKLETVHAISSSLVVDAKGGESRDDEDKSVKAHTAEVHVKDAAEPVKQVQAESSVLVLAKDSHKTDVLAPPISDVKPNSKKKKKKDGASRAISGDVLKVSKPQDIKKQAEEKVSDAPKAKLELSKSVEQAEATVSSTAAASEIVPHPTDVEIPELQTCSCNGELLRDHSVSAVEQGVPSSRTSDNEEMVVSDPIVEEVHLDATGVDEESLVNSVNKLSVTDPGPSSDENIEYQSRSSTVEVDGKHSVDHSEVIVSVTSPRLSDVADAVESACILESQVSTVEVPVEVSEGASKKVSEVEVPHETAASLTTDVDGAELVSSMEACKEEEVAQLQKDSVEPQSSAQSEVFTNSSSKEDSSEGIPVPVASDIKLSSKKKKKKDILAKADAAGTTADLYNAYKAPQEKKPDEPMSSKAGTPKGTVVDPVKQVIPSTEAAVTRELDDWEDAVELPTPKGSTAEGVHITRENDAMQMNGGETYTRDFLLTFKDQNMELPLDFEVRPDIAELLLNPQAAFARLADREMHIGSGRMLDRQLSGGPRRSGPSNTFDEERWARQPQGLHSPLWPDNYADMGPAGGFRLGNAQGLIPRMPPNIRPGITVPPMVPGLISGKPLTPAASPGLFRTNTVDSDRWQKMPTGQKGLIPSPLTPLPPVHKSENRYEVGKVSDEEAQKQRQIKAILNKLTPQNFQKLFEQVKDVNIQSAITLTGVISQIFDKALTEPTFCEMYATFCKQLATDMPEFVEDGDKVTFKRVLLNKCQEEFHRGEREQAEASTIEEEGQETMSPEEREEKRVKAKRRMLGNIRFIGELYKKHMLTERIMHECIRKLLGDIENPEEEDVEALCKLMSTIGTTIDQPKSREHIDAYLERITIISNNQKLSARIRFMLKDLIDLRRNGWQERRKVEGPKKIDEVRRDAVQERQATVAQAGRLSRGPSMSASSGRRLVPPPELNTRGPISPMLPPNTPIGATPSSRGAQSQIGIRGSFIQDVRMEDRLLLDSRSVPVTLSQRPLEEVPLTLGPQGGLGRGMSLRSQPSGSGRNFQTDAAPGLVTSDSRRFGPVSMAAYSGGGPSGVERPLTPPERPLLDRPAGPSDRIGPGSSNRSFRQLERTLSDRAMSMSTASNSHQQHQGPSTRPSTAPASVPLSDDQLRKKSEATLMEYFSVHDSKEAAQCVEELKAPNFHPKMVCTWISISLEKRNVERELLAKLLIHLQNCGPFLLKQEQILQGFEMTLESLEDLALDTPKAPEYLAEMLVILTSAGTLSLDQVGALLKRDDLLQSGFGPDMIGKVLSGLRRDRGEKSLMEMFRSSGIRLEDFVISGSSGSKSLSEFLQKYNLQCFDLEPDQGTSLNVHQVGIQLLEHLNKNEPVSDILRWLEKSIEPPMRSDSSFLQMLMTQVLKHSMPAGISEKDQRTGILKERISQYSTLLSKFAACKEKQRQYIVAMQLFVHDIDHPTGLMTSLFDAFYELEVISESAFYKWEDDVKDTTVGRDKALRDVYRWLAWLRTAPEQSQDDEF